MTPEQKEKLLLIIVRDFLTQFATQRAVQAIQINANLEKDLGIDSLGKAELISRIEKQFDIKISSTAISQAETLQDLLQSINEAKPRSKIFEPITKITALKSSIVDISKAKHLPEALKIYALQDPNRPHIYLQDDEGNETVITYGQLYADSMSIARGLIARGIRQGETVALMLPTCAEFFSSFFGILYAGAIPVPIYPPFRPDRIEEYIKREANILRNAEIRGLITFSRANFLTNILKSFIPSLICIATAQALKESKGSHPKVEISNDDIALIQYTSGSTGNPKGVIIQHKNMMANLHAINRAIVIQPTDAVVSWLPLYHDMGLMSWIASLYFGLPFTVLSPLTFLSHPERWLWAIHYHRASFSAGPNFAYELCSRKIDPSQIEGLDLSSWRLAFNGAEAVNPETMRKFAKKFQVNHFKAQAIYPVYGLAENTVALTFPQYRKGLHTDIIDKKTFENTGVAKSAENKHDVLEFVNCGSAIPHHQIRVVDDEDNALPERHVGNIQFQGPSRMTGYYRNISATENTIKNDWCDTGDCGYLVRGELYITGRKKDLIIKAGRNIYPETIENTVNQILGIRKGCVIAFGVTDKHSGTELLIIVAEIQPPAQDKKSQIEKDIVTLLSEHVGIVPDKIVFVAPHTIPKTSSGKLQRSLCKQMYSQRQFEAKKRSVPLQLFTLTLKSVLYRLKNFIKQLLKIFYSLYAGSIFAITIFMTWCLALILPRNIGMKVLKLWPKIMFALIGCRIEVIGEEHLYKNKPVIFASNHTSYADVPLLLSILPGDTAFITKKELMNYLMIRTIIRKYRFITVNRLDFSKSIQKTEHIVGEVKKGRSVLIFPEGTFSFATGVRPFKSGAFRIAAVTNTPVCPIAIKGARELMRGHSVILKPAKITITIGELIYPEGDDWNAMNELRIKTKAFIAEHCGEGSLDIISMSPAKQ